MLMLLSAYPNLLGTKGYVVAVVNAIVIFSYFLDKGFRNDIVK
jgi:hypothetical protein